jgi:uncharacterized protein
VRARWIQQPRGSIGIVRSPGSTTGFSPHRLLRSGHIQTLTCAASAFTHAFPNPAGTQSEDLWVEVSGGSILARANWLGEAGVHSRRPVALLVHGVGGADSSSYVVRAAVGFLAAGYHVVRMNLRGAGESIRRAPSLYHMGLTSDLADLVAHVNGRPEVGACFVVGFSGGGNVALKLAAASHAQASAGSSLPAAIAGISSISAPLDLAGTATHMKRARNLPYHAHVLRGLHRSARGLLRYRPSAVHYSLMDLARSTSLQQFDARVTVPMHGFDSVAAYYASASAGPDLGRVAIPSLILHAEDDPMVPIETIRNHLRAASAAVEVRVTRHGGHLGFIADLQERSWTQTWAIRETLAFFETLSGARNDS